MIMINTKYLLYNFINAIILKIHLNQRKQIICIIFNQYLHKIDNLYFRIQYL